MALSFPSPGKPPTELRGGEREEERGASNDDDIEEEGEGECSLREDANEGEDDANDDDASGDGVRDSREWRPCKEEGEGDNNARVERGLGDADGDTTGEAAADPAGEATTDSEDAYRLPVLPAVAAPIPAAPLSCKARN